MRDLTVKLTHCTRKVIISKIGEIVLMFNIRLEKSIRVDTNEHIMSYVIVIDRISGQVLYLDFSRGSVPVRIFFRISGIRSQFIIQLLSLNLSLLLIELKM